MCNCKKDIEKQLLDRFKAQAPEATGHGVELLGYGFVLGKNIVQKGAMDIKQTATFPLKKGGVKEKTTKQNLMFTYCPFCAKPYETEAATDDA